LFLFADPGAEQEDVSAAPVVSTARQRSDPPQRSDRRLPRTST
jgi:hypothetical protein